MVKITLLTLLLLFSLTAGDNEMLQDVCVADLTSSVKVNGYTCKPEAEISAEDFSFTGIAKDGGGKNNPMGWSGLQVTVEVLPGLNTLGISMFYVDIARKGITLTHSHPRGTEMFFVLQGQVDIGFITTSNKHISKTVSEKEVFVVPKGLMHYLINKRDAPATVIAAINSQSPGATIIGETFFAANPPLPDDVLTANFRLSTDEVQKIKQSFAPNQQ